MKKISGFLSLTIVLAGFTVLSSCKNMGSSSSNSDFQGVVSYEIKPDTGLPAQAVAMFKTVEMLTSVKGNMCRSDEKMAGNNTITICDSKTPDDPTMLVSMLGHKYAIKYNDSLKKIAASMAPKIEYIDSASAVKTIAGYSCKKAKLTTKSPMDSLHPMVTYMYYTTDLPYADPKGQFKGLKGMPMEYTVSTEGITLTISAKSVEKKALSDSLFAIPSDYKQMSITDMEKEIMKSMGSGTDTASGSGSGTK